MALCFTSDAKWLDAQVLHNQAELGGALVQASTPSTPGLYLGVFFSPHFVAQSGDETSSCCV